MRQLKNAVERAVLMEEGEIIAAQDLVLDRRARRVDATSTGTLQIDAEGGIAVIFPPQGLALDQVEQAFIQAALQHVAGNVSQAAALLHMSCDTLRYRIDKYGLDNKTNQPG